MHSYWLCLLMELHLIFGGETWCERVNIIWHRRNQPSNITNLFLSIFIRITAAVAAVVAAAVTIVPHFFFFSFFFQRWWMWSEFVLTAIPHRVGLTLNWPTENTQPTIALDVTPKINLPFRVQCACVKYFPSIEMMCQYVFWFRLCTPAHSLIHLKWLNQCTRTSECTRTHTSTKFCLQCPTIRCWMTEPWVYRIAYSLWCILYAGMCVMCMWERVYIDAANQTDCRKHVEM